MCHTTSEARVSFRTTCVTVRRQLVKRRSVRAGSDLLHVMTFCSSVHVKSRWGVLAYRHADWEITLRMEGIALKPQCCQPILPVGSGLASA